MRRRINLCRAGWLGLVLAVVYLHTPWPARIYAMAQNTEPNHPASDVTITQTGLEVTHKTLQLQYEITNESADDVWICDSMAVNAWCHFEVYLDEDDRTLFVRRRLDLESSGSPTVIGLYVRLRAGETRHELMSFPLPVRYRHVVSDGRLPRPPRTATRCVLEIGYYRGDLPAALLDILTEADQLNSDTAYGEPSEIKVFMGGPLHFATSNERQRNSNDRVLIPYTRQKLKGERVASLAIEDVSIPYTEQYKRLTAPDLGACTRMEIRFEPSALEFLFPSRHEQELLSSIERKKFQSTKTLFIEDQRLLESLVQDIGASRGDAFMLEGPTVHLLCYNGDKNTKALLLDSDASILTEDGQVFRYPDCCGHSLPTLRGITPEVQAVTLRINCAGNLTDLCLRLRLYSTSEGSSSGDADVVRQTTYPDPAKWGDDAATPFARSARRRAMIVRRYVCASAGAGKCHYAMNPNCRPDSPGDMVLLFETKAGWNQHGGPELFTFDNHDPKGGCVLLNDGTVKFIRSKTELHALRWE